MAKGVGDVLYSILSNDTNINGIVGTKIYPFLAIEDVVYPYIVYTIEGVDPTQTDDGVSILDVNSANIEIYSEDLSENETLSKYVRNALDRYKGTVEGIEVQSISFRSENGGYADADRVYLKIQDYSLRMVTASCMFGRVTDLSSSTVSTSQIDLSWTDVATGETGWQIWTSQDFINWSLVDTIAADSTSYSVTGLTTGNSYSYKIRAIDSTDNGEWSNIVIASSNIINVSNSTDNYSVDTSTDLELPDNTIVVTNDVDTVLSTTYNPVYDNITIEVPIAPAPPSEWLEIEVDTTISGNTPSDSFELGFLYNAAITIDWESNGVLEYHVSGTGVANARQLLHQYPSSGVYTIRLKGIASIYMNPTDDRFKVTKLKNCGEFTFTDGNAFRGCSNMVASTTDLIRHVGTLRDFFDGCNSLVVPPKIKPDGNILQTIFKNTSLNADLGYMDLRNIINFNSFANGVTTWNQTNYEATWEGWLRWDSGTGDPEVGWVLNSGATFHGGSSTVRTGTNGAAARSYAINTLGWVVTDGGEV